MAFYNLIVQLCFILMVYKDGLEVVSASAPTVATPSLWQQGCIEKHNFYRNQHKTGPIQWSNDLKQNAEIWAKYLADSQVTSRGEIGENLYLTNGKQLPNCTDIVNVFYNEIRNYNYDNPGWSKNTERFSQVLWKNTLNLAVAFSQRKDGKYVVVFRYKPPGNYKTKTAYQQNVLPPPVKAAGTRIVSYQTMVIAVVMAVWGGFQGE